MRTFSSIILLLFLAGASAAQQRIQRVIPVLPEQHFVLNGGMNATFQNGKSRQVFSIQLPPNTVKWYYTFSTSILGDGGKKQLQLATQLTRLVDQTGISAIALSALLTPPGVAYADVYLMDEPNARLFLIKADLDGQTFRYALGCSRENYKEGTVEIQQPRQGTFFLGIRNPATVSGIDVSLEVAAIVEDDAPQSESQQKAVLYGNLGWASYEKGNYENCITLSQKALSYEENLPWVKCNIALCYLVLGRQEYLDTYVDAIACCKKSPQARSYLEAAMQDLRRAPVTSKENVEQMLLVIERELQGF